MILLDQFLKILYLQKMFLDLCISLQAFLFRFKSELNNAIMI